MHVWRNPLTYIDYENKSKGRNGKGVLVAIARKESSEIVWEDKR